MSESKNAYEIRLDLLKMAKDMLDKQYQITVDSAWKIAEQAQEEYKGPAGVLFDPTPYMPKMFTPEEVMEQAKKFQEFVNGK